MARSSAKRVVGTLLFVVALALFLGFLFLVYAQSNNDDSIGLVDDLPEVAVVVAVVLGIILVTLLLMLLLRRWDERSETAEAGEVFFVPDEPKPAARPAAPATTFEAMPEIAVYDLRKVPQSKGSWGQPENSGNQAPFYFPRNVAAGVYINDYIQVAPGKTLKLRTLMAGPYDPAYVDDSQPRSRTQAAPSQKAAQSLVAAATRGRQKMVLEEASDQQALAPTETYYDYPGDNHDIEDIEGIGTVYGERLRKLGIHTTARLAYEDVGSLAERMELPRKTVEQWKHMAELIKVSGIGPQYAEALVRAGIEGIAELKRRSPAKIADQVNAYLDTLSTNVLGTKITEKRVEGWQDKARPMKRIRLQVPAQ
jgi:predicted flap endonuclease-1-like 5' DNA nuclease